MAVVPDKRQLYEHKLSTLKTNRQIVLEALQQVLLVGLINLRYSFLITWRAAFLGEILSMFLNTRVVQLLEKMLYLVNHKQGSH